jgi:hypothetical protein
MKIGDAMDSMLDNHPYRLWIFRVLPQVRINSGYDSNGLYSVTGEVGDYFVSAAPGGSFALRLGSRAFLVLEEDLNFVYYQELEQRRDIFNRTALRFTTGSRKTLLSLFGGYVSKKEPVDSEFDRPAQQKTISGGSRFEVGLTPKLNLLLNVSAVQNLYQQDPEIISIFPPPPDHNIFGFGTLFDYRVHPRFALLAGSDLSRTEFLDFDDDRNSIRFFGGVRLIGPSSRGQVRLGLRQTDGETPEEPDLSSFFADGSVTFLIRESTRIGFFIRRDHDVSRIGIGNFRITTEGGVRGSFPIARNLFGDGSYRIGKNDYGRQVLFGKDHFQTAGAGLNFRFQQDLILRGGLSYYRRVRGEPSVITDRIAYEIGINYVVSLE